MSKLEYLLSILMELPPNLEKIEQELINNDYTGEDVTLAASRFAERCFCERGDFEEAFKRKPRKEEVHSGYIYEIYELFLKYGLNPNEIIPDRSSVTNIMYQLEYIDYEYNGAKTLRLLLENGGDVNLIFDGEFLFDMLDFDVIFDVVELNDKQRFDNEFKMWLLMIGFGATIKNRECPIEVLNGYAIENFKNFENYRYEIEFIKDDWIMHIIDMIENIEVAKL